MMMTPLFKRLLRLLLVGAVLCIGLALTLPWLRFRLAVRAAMKADGLDDGGLVGGPGQTLTAADVGRLWDTGRFPHRRAALGAWMDSHREESDWKALSDRIVREVQPRTTPPPT